MPIDVSAFVGQHLAMVLIAVIFAGAHREVSPRSRPQERRLWVAAWALLALSHAGFAALAWLAPIPGTLDTPYVWLSTATSVVGYLSVVAVCAGVVSSRLDSWFLCTAFSVGVVVVGAGVMFLASIGPPNVFREHMMRFAAQTGIVSLATFGGGVAAAAVPPERGARQFWFPVSLVAYSLPMGLYAFEFVRLAGMPMVPALGRLLAIGHLEFATTALLGVNVVLGAVHRIRALSIQRSAVEQDARRRLEAGDARFRSLVAQVPALLLIVDRSGICRDYLRRGPTRSGYDAADWDGRPWQDVALAVVHPDDQAGVFSIMTAALAVTDSLSTMEVRLRAPDGDWLLHECTVKNCMDVETIQGMVLTGTDISQHRALEKRVAQAERLESVGRLAAGVAHDFNNLLTVVHGNTSLLATSMPADSPDRVLTTEIHQAAERGSRLTQQLLAFSRRQPMAPRVFDIGQLVTDLLPIIRRLLPDRVAIRWAPDPAGAWVLADPHSIEQVLINLATNARDAMPSGGVFSLGVRRGPDSVDVVATDTGTGMTEEVALRAVEPFFTTKDVGFGAGLGLAISLGTVQQAGGTLTIESRLGHGTTVRVTLPSAPPETATPVTTMRARQAVADTLTLLIVDDDSSVRRLATRTLQEAGYCVLEADSARAALGVIQERPDVRIVVTDVVMPGLSGEALARRVWEMLPTLPVLFVSGYADQFSPGETAGPWAFLQKPYHGEGLLEAVRTLVRGN